VGFFDSIKYSQPNEYSRVIKFVNEYHNITIYPEKSSIGIRKPGSTDHINHNTKQVYEVLSNFLLDKRNIIVEFYMRLPDYPLKSLTDILRCISPNYYTAILGISIAILFNDEYSHNCIPLITSFFSKTGYSSFYTSYIGKWNRYFFKRKDSI
jgi:hypothetical protein